MRAAPMASPIPTARRRCDVCLTGTCASSLVADRPNPAKSTDRIGDSLIPAVPVGPRS